LYGRSWEGVPATNNGLDEPGTAGPNTGEDGNWDNGVFEYWKVVNLKNTSGYTYTWDSDSKVPSLYGPNITSGLTGGMFISYDDTNSITQKVFWVQSNFYLGGVMLWELSGDIHDATATDSNNIVGYVYTALFPTGVRSRPIRRNGPMFINLVLNN
jgi:GH18 family chitinase